MPEAVSKQEIQLVIFKIGDEEFGVSISQVREIVRLVPITPIPRAPEFIEGVVNLRGQIIAVIDLARRINLKANPRSEKSRIVVVEINESNAGMIVDEVVEVLRLPTASIEETPELLGAEAHHKYLKGVGKLQDRLLIILDLAKILTVEEAEGLKQASQQLEDDEKVIKED